MEAARDAHAVLAEMQRVLGELEELLADHGSAASLPPASPPAAPPPATASLSAGPFSAIEAVDAFGARLRDLEGVVDVVHTGFEGERALFDVHLGGASLVCGR